MSSDQAEQQPGHHAASSQDLVVDGAPQDLAVVVHAAGDLRVEERPLAEPAAHEAVVRIAYGGICGSDLHYVSHGAAGMSVLREPMVLGHEVVGTVERSAVDGSGPPPGTRVAVHPGTPLPGDGSRYPADRPNLAPGTTYLGSAAHLPHTQGAFARRAVLPTRMLRALPDGLPLEVAALAEPAAVAWHAVVQAGGIDGVRGRSALVIGAGPIGALVVAVLARAGASPITVVDVLDEPLERARALGATATIRAGADGAPDAIAALAADVVVEASGSAPGLASALRGCVRGGRVVMLGLLPPGQQPVEVALAISRELELVGSFRFVDEIDDVVAALADGSLVTDGVVTQVLPLADAAQAFAVAADARASCKVLLDLR